MQARMLHSNECPSGECYANDSNLVARVFDDRLMWIPGYFGPPIPFQLDPGVPAQVDQPLKAICFALISAPPLAFFVFVRIFYSMV